MAEEFFKQLKAFVEQYENMKQTLENARLHIKRNITKFSPKELECMAVDHIINYTDVPSELQTDFVRSIAQRST